MAPEGPRISSAKGGARFAIQVAPQASRNALTGVQQGALRVRLTAPPVEGAANRALIAFVARLLDVPKRDVENLSGHGSRRKAVVVRGLVPQEVAARL